MLKVNSFFARNFSYCSRNENLILKRFGGISDHKTSCLKFQIKNFSSINLNKDYYRILGVTPSASEKDIKIAYLNLVKKHHPDVAGGNSTEYFKEISTSFNILSDKTSKSFYDSNSENVLKYYSKNTAFDDSIKNSDQKNHFYSNEYEFNSQGRNDFYSKYNNRNYYKYHKYNTGQHSNYYQDQKGKSYNIVIFNFEISDLINDFCLYLPKIMMMLAIYMFYILITHKTKNEYHLFIE